jgi:hypothetical protein
MLRKSGEILEDFPAHSETWGGCSVNIAAPVAFV